MYCILIDKTHYEEDRKNFYFHVFLKKLGIHKFLEMETSQFNFTEMSQKVTLRNFVKV